MSKKALKIAISGKGGVGKTSVSGMLIRHLASSGRRVIAVDADPVASLGAALGIPDYDKIEPVVSMNDLIYERTGAKPGTMGGFFKMNPKVDDIPEKYAAVKDNIHLLVMGTVDHGGSGCVCPESVILKALITHLTLFQNDAIVMDMEAGVEHLGRATTKGIDLMLVVVEPGSRSINAARMIKKLAADIGLDRVAIVANKVRGDGDKRAIGKALADFPILGFLPYESELVEADLAGEVVYQDAFPAHVQKVLTSIVDYANTANQ